MKKTPINPVAIALLFLLVMTGLWLVITDAIRFAREAAVPIPPTPATVVVSAEPTEIKWAFSEESLRAWIDDYAQGLLDKAMIPPGTIDMDDPGTWISPDAIAPGYRPGDKRVPFVGYLYRLDAHERWAVTDECIGQMTVAYEEYGNGWWISDVTLTYLECHDT